MAKKKLAVAVIHGIGGQRKKPKSKPDTLHFSKPLRDRIAREMKNARTSIDFDTNIAWREVFWSDVIEKRQQTYLGKIKRKTRSDAMRSFVLSNLSDASAYRKTTSDSNDTTYEKIHARVTRTIKTLERDVEPGAPLVVLAHSLGGHIMSNYIYDACKNCDKIDAEMGIKTDFQKMKTMGGFVTFGCNIPLFTFAYPAEKVFPISFPGTSLPKEKQLTPWWLNYYDKDDILGYPLKEIGPNYNKLSKQLEERPINAGNAFTSWNPLSHNGYWKDDDIYRPVARFLAKFL